MVDAPDETLAELLKRLRLAAGLTQEELAGTAGISTRSVSDLERGITRATRKETARLLAHALGLSGPVRDVFYVVARGRAVPAGRDGGQLAGQLPVPATPLVGRARDVGACCGLLLSPDVRLVTLTGLGGVGKTRTAIAVAHELAGRFPDGACFISLAPVRDPQLVIATVARVLGLRESGTRPLQAQVADRLARQRALLLLDNFEQVIEAAAVVADLLSRCPQVKFLTTSRRPLRINGEHEYPLAPLEVPSPVMAEPAEMLRSPAVQLLGDRITAYMPGWSMSADDVAAVAAICRRLDGLPLALELAAARAKVLSPPELLARLERRGDVLSLGTRDADDRHRTLRATLDWSYHLLDDRAARLLPQLSVFADGWTLDAMTSVCDLGDEMEALDALAALIDNSLVWRAWRPAGTRFLLPATIRDYAAQLLSAGGISDAVRRRHLNWALDLAECAEPELTGASQLSWLALLGDEHANVRAALDYAVTAGETATAYRLTAALWRYWETTGQLAEGRHWLARILALRGPVPPLIRGRALRADGNLARDQGDADAAMSLHQRALAIFEQAGSDTDVARALNSIGNVHLDRGDAESAIACYEASLNRIAGSGEPWLEAMLFNNLALAMCSAGERGRAGELARQSLAAFERLADGRGVARATETLARVHSGGGQFALSLPLHQQAARLFSQVGDRAGVARAIGSMARASAALGDPAGAAWLVGRADALRTQAGEALTADERAAREETMAVIQSVLTPSAITAALAAGRDAQPGELADRIAAGDEPPAGRRAKVPGH